jgi:hypothetical protein
VPETPCDNCTLQVIQMMDGNMDDPVPDPVGRSSYYQCADIVIEAPPEVEGSGACSLARVGEHGASGVSVLSLLVLGALLRGRRLASAR